MKEKGASRCAAAMDYDIQAANGQDAPEECALIRLLLILFVVVLAMRRVIAGNYTKITLC